MLGWPPNLSAHMKNYLGDFSLCLYLLTIVEGFSEEETENSKDETKW